MKILDTIFKKVQTAVNQFCAAALLLTIAIIVIQTFARYVLHSSIPWSEELSRYLFVLIIALCFNVAISKELLVNINILDNQIKNRSVLHFLEIFRLCVGLFTEIFFLISSFQLIGIGWVQKSPALQITMSWMYIFVTIGFALSVIAVIAKIVEKITLYGKEEGQ